MDANAPKFGIALLTFVLGYIYSQLGMLFMILVILSCIDFITGLIAGALLKQLNSRRGLEGIFRKVSLLLLVPVSVMIDMTLQTTGYISPNKPVLYGLVCSWLIAVEVMSILENAERAGLPIPPMIKPLVGLLGTPPKKQTQKKRKSNIKQ